MKNIIIAILLLCGVATAQNTDKGNYMPTTQQVFYNTFEKTAEVIRTSTNNNFSIVMDSIVAGDSTTGVIDLGAGKYLSAIILPSGWDAADLTFRASTAIDGTKYDVYDKDDAELTYQAGASRWIVVRPVDFFNIQFIELRSGTSASDVDQTDTVIITLIVRGY